MENFPLPIRKLLEELRTSFDKIIGNNLIGIYLHGSLTMGCFNPKSSDVDFLVVTREKLTLSQKKKIIELSLKVSDIKSNNGLEYSIVTVGSLKHFRYPPAYELHFSNEWKDGYVKGKANLNKQRYDPDLVAHIVVIKKRGICIIGQPIKEIFPSIPEKYFRKVLSEEIKYIFKILPEHPTYCVLNLSRLLAYGQDKLILSKKEGGEWAVNNLDAKFHNLIKQALDQYLGTKTETLNSEKVTEFAKYSKDLWTKMKFSDSYNL